MKLSKCFFSVSLALLALAGVPATQALPLVGFPDATPNATQGIPNSGKFIDVSRGLATMGDVAPGDKVFNVSLAVPASLTQFKLSIFDADMGGLWDRFTPGEIDQIKFELYRDPNLVGSTEPGDLLGTWDNISATFDNKWCDLGLIGQVGQANCTGTPGGGTQMLNRADTACPNLPAGNCFYHLVARWKTEVYENQANFFKVAVEGTAFLLGGSTIGFQAEDSDTASSPGDLNYPTASTDTAYDGVFEFQFFVPEELLVLDMFDGDFDRADDSDDPNTPSTECRDLNDQRDYVSGVAPNDVTVQAWANNQDASAGCSIWEFDNQAQDWVEVHFPPFQQSANTLAQGANLGDPRDDPIANLSDPIEFVVPPNIKYSVSAPLADPTDPTSSPPWTVVNDNPSGNKDWELFRIVKQNALFPSGVTVTPDLNATVLTIPAGLYTWKIEGADAGNNLFIHSKYNLFPTSDGLCDLSVTKTCEVVQPPTSFVCSDAKPIDSLTMIWDGPDGVYVQPYIGYVSGGNKLGPLLGPFNKGDVVTVSGYAGAGNDNEWQITGTITGKSSFHKSCSDVDMNGPEDCGKYEGDGKALSGTWINLWKFEGMTGNGQELICTPPGGSTVNECTATLREASCETLGKPTSLTFRYTGGGCEASNNTQAPDKATCSGAIDPTQAVTVTTTNSGYSIASSPVDPGQKFTVSASKFDADSFFNLTDIDGGTEALKIHTSCSQPLKVGDVYGSLTLVSFNGDSGGANVLYEYTVTGGDTENVVLYDSVLGQIAGPFDLSDGEPKIFQETANIIQTTTNVATVVGVQDITQCIANASATVTVEGPPPPECKALGASTLRIDDDKIEWKITNQGSDRLTISSIEIEWPAAKGNLTKVKRDKDEIFKGSLGPTSATITSFTNKLDKRQLKAGEQRKLVFEFSKKYKGTAGEYKIRVNFAEGCAVTFTPGSSGAFTCTKPINELTMIWTSTELVDIKAWKGAVNSTLLAEFDDIGMGTEVTVTGYAGAPNDVIWQIFKAGTANPYGTGQSTFHLSCSDVNMDGKTDNAAFPNDCGKLQGDGKDKIGYVNEWILEGMVDSKGTLDCTP